MLCLEFIIIFVFVVISFGVLYYESKLYYISIECYFFVLNFKNLKIRVLNFCRNFIYIVLLLENFFF